MASSKPDAGALLKADHRKAEELARFEAPGLPVQQIHA